MTREDDPALASRRTGGGWRIGLTLVVIAIIAGAALITWLVMGDELQGKLGFGSTPVQQQASVAADPAPVQTNRAAPAQIATLPAAQPAAPSAVAPAVDASAAVAPALAEIRVADMEDRLARLRVAAESAGAQAARGEAILVAAAARRSIDRGLPLGYVGEQLQRRFADTNPQAVRAILAASREPVTIEQLQGGLDDLGGRLMAGSADTGLWDRIVAEFSGLFTLRKAGTPSPEPAQRLKRAQRFLGGGNVVAAVAEVERMPGHASAAAWLAAARRQIATQQALDTLEASVLNSAAILAVPVAAAIPAPAPDTILTAPVSPTATP